MTEISDIAAELLRRRSALDGMREFREFMKPTGELDYKFAPAANICFLLERLKELVVSITHSGANETSLHSLGRLCFEKKNFAYITQSLTHISEPT